MSLDLIPMLLLSLLLLTSGGDVERVELVTGGAQRVEAGAGALVVADGDVTVPAGVVLDGPVHVLGGSLDVRGTVTGDVLVLSGSVSVAGEGRVAGHVQHYGGDLTVSPGGEARVAGLEVRADRRGVAEDVASTLVGAGLLGLVGWWWARRRPRAVRTIGDAVRRHPVITLTVGALVAVTAISLLVFMAFTLVLLPVTVLGLAAGVALFAYGVIGLGGLVGRLLPVERSALATALGVGAVVVGLRVLQLVPVVGGLLALGVLLAGLGAVLVTYLGLKPFAPVALPA